MNHLGLLLKLLLGIVVGTLIGLFGLWTGLDSDAVYCFLVRLLITFSGLFSTFLAFLIPLLILSFVACGLSDLGQKAGKLFFVTVALAYGTTVLSGFLAFFIGREFLPRFIKPLTTSDIGSVDFASLFTIAVPPMCDVMTALALAFFFGLGLAYFKAPALQDMLHELQTIVTVTLEKIVIPLIPFYIAGLFVEIAVEGKLWPTIKMFSTLYGCIIVLQLCYIVMQFVLASIIRRENCLPRIRNIFPAYMSALGTQSSAVTIPVALQCAYKNEVKRDVADFVVPLCATINLNGDAICLVLGCMGIMIANGQPISMVLFTPFIFMLGIIMVAAPGVPGGGVMAALGLISSMLGFTEPMQQLIIALHFSQDSFGTATNVSGDQAVALIVDHVDKLQDAKADALAPQEA